MKYTYILLGIFSFIFLSSLLAVGQRTEITERLAMADFQHVEMAYAMTKENAGAVLGVSVGSGEEEMLVQQATTKTTALKLLQENSIVVVEYTDAGAIVRAVDGKGMSDEDRTNGKSWSFKINDVESELPSDRAVIESGDTIVWAYR